MVYLAEGQSTSAFAQGSAPSTPAAAPTVDPSQQYPSAPEAPQGEQPVESHSHRIITGICPSMHDSPSMQKLQALLPWVSFPWDIKSLVSGLAL